MAGVPTVPVSATHIHNRIARIVIKSWASADNQYGIDKVKEVVIRFV